MTGNRLMEILSCKFCQKNVYFEGRDIYHEKPTCPEFVKLAEAMGAKRIGERTNIVIDVKVGKSG